MSAAYTLAVEKGMQGILLVDQGAPLSLTSDHSTECYRNWWPGPGDAMVALMNRSIERLEALGPPERQHLPPEPARLSVLHRQTRSALPRCSGDGEQISALGAGPLRLHRGRPGDPLYQPVHPEDFEQPARRGRPAARPGADPASISLT